jgi:hypothetical protein
MEDYPNNETLMAVIEAIDETKITAPSSAEIGQILAVKHINENGVPIEWECINNSQATIPEIATDDEIIEMLAQEDLLPVVADADGSILTDESENILLW